MYKIIGADGKEYGPVTVEQLKDWLAQRRLYAQTRVQAVGSTEWKPAGEIPELAFLFAPAASAPAPSAPPILNAPKPSAPRNGLAIVSFILGLSSFVLCLSAITGVPAIICGHIARRRTVQSPGQYGGAGFAKAGIILGYMSIVFSAVIIAMVLHAPSSRMGPRAFRPPPERNDCQNNLRQIGLAFKVWALEHNDQFPFNVSTNQGGSLELCARDADGFELNPLPHFLIISGDLSNPRFLACPNDSSKHPAADFSSLEPANVSYRLRTGTNINVDNPQEVLAVCPVHGFELFVDGNVRKRR
jgi:hypothetical protein